MKIVGTKWIMCAVLSVCTLAVMAQNDLTIKVTNIRSAKGRVMVATDKGQYHMVEAKGADAVMELKAVPEGKFKLYVFHDENGNSQLDRENGIPVENCAIVELDVKSDTKAVDVELKDIQKEVKNN